MRSEKRKRGIVVRAFFETGKDGTESLLEYIDKLERTCITQDKVIYHRRKRRSLVDLHKIIGEYL